MGKKLEIGKNDLKTVAPEVAAEWSYELNSPLEPKNVSALSNKKAYWQCSNNHIWLATICNRTNGRGCPVCANLKVLHGINDLVTLRVDIAEEWNCEKNKGIKPENFVPGSNKKVWWKCKEGHEWEATIMSRNYGRNCPYCAGNKVIKGKTDLISTNPDLIREWDYEKNFDIKPEDVSSGSGKVIWWKCVFGHEWKSTVYNRTGGRGCPYCAGKKVNQGENDLATIYPELIKEWNYEKNGPLFPSQVTVHSNRRVWWKCEKGHEWQVNINTRIKKNKISGCPYCGGVKTIKGENDLVTINPKLATEWDYDKNRELLPNMVLATSYKKVWWKCKEGHSWEAIIKSRNLGRGCPYCSGRRSIKGKTDLVTVNPEVAQEWSYEKNNGLVPDDIGAHSNKKVWWKCKCGHEWISSINHRSHGNECPYCRIDILKKTD